MNSLGKKIEELRKSAGVTQEELASVVDVSRQSVYQWEADITVPKADKLKALCEYFNVKSDYFLFEDATKEPLVNPAEETAVASAEGVNPQKRSRKKRVLIILSVIIGLLAAAIMLFIAWLNAPTPGVDYSESYSSWNFDMVTILQILAGIILFEVACVIVALIVKHFKNRKK